MALKAFTEALASDPALAMGLDGVHQVRRPAVVKKEKPLAHAP